MPSFGPGFSPLLVSVDGAGAAHWARDQHPSGQTPLDEGVVHVFRSGSGWQKEDIAPAGIDPIGRVAALEFGQDSIPRAWVQMQLGQYALATRTTTGVWELSDMIKASVESSVGFTVDKLGRPVTFQMLNGTVEVTVGGSTVVAATDVLCGRDGCYAPAQGVARPLDASEPAYAFAIMREKGLSVVWQDVNTVREVSIPETAAVPMSCPHEVLKDDNGACRSDCLERQHGVLPFLNTWSGGNHHHFGLGRTDDGSLWLAYIATEVDRTIAYREFCTEVCGSWCTAGIREDRSTSELRVVRVPTDGSPPEPIMQLGLGHFSDGSVEDPFVSVRAFGMRVAVGVHGLALPLQPSDFAKAAPHARVITLDVGAKSLPAP